MVTLILNPKAKEAHDKRMKEVAEMYGETPLYLKVYESPLWQTVKEYIPYIRNGEIITSLIYAIENGTNVELDMHNFDSAMCWENTPQGHDYWSKIHDITLENGL